MDGRGCSGLSQLLIASTVADARSRDLTLGSAQSPDFGEISSPVGAECHPSCKPGVL